MYVIQVNECYDFDNTTTIRLTENLEKAKEIFEEEKNKFKEFVEDYDTIESGEKYMTMFNYGDFSREHIDIYIVEKVVE